MNMFSPAFTVNVQGQDVYVLTRNNEYYCDYAQLYAIDNAVSAEIADGSFFSRKGMSVPGVKYVHVKFLAKYPAFCAITKAVNERYPQTVRNVGSAHVMSKKHERSYAIQVYWTGHNHGRTTEYYCKLSQVRKLLVDPSIKSVMLHIHGGPSLSFVSVFMLSDIVGFNTIVNVVRDHANGIVADNFDPITVTADVPIAQVAQNNKDRSDSDNSDNSDDCANDNTNDAHKKSIDKLFALVQDPQEIDLSTVNGVSGIYVLRVTDSNQREFFKYNYVKDLLYDTLPVMHHIRRDGYRVFVVKVLPCDENIAGNLINAADNWNIQCNTGLCDDVWGYISLYKPENI